ncbi:MAG: hypothetical protein QOJ60_2132 [Actinomycetota bacterium]|nr:hypothetical protein [Actinomycetota bacterium]
MSSASATRRAAALATGLVAGLLVAGCLGPGVVAVAPPSPGLDVSSACGRLVRALPMVLAGGSARRTSPKSPYVRAWGDPPLVVRCGVPIPAGLRPTSQLVVVDGVQWYVEQHSHGVTYTTVGRAANVEVAVPDDHQQATAPLAQLAGQVQRILPSTG